MVPLLGISSHVTHVSHVLVEDTEHVCLYIFCTDRLTTKLDESTLIPRVTKWIQDPREWHENSRQTIMLPRPPPRPPCLSSSKHVNVRFILQSRKQDASEKATVCLSSQVQFRLFYFVFFYLFDKPAEAFLS